jgi:hypothetical protein
MIECQRDALLGENQRLRTRLAAMRSLVILLLNVIRLSGFTFEGKRLPAGQDKKRLLRAIQRAEIHCKLAKLLPRIGLFNSRYCNWINTKKSVS